MSSTKPWSQDQLKARSFVKQIMSEAEKNPDFDVVGLWEHVVKYSADPDAYEASHETFGSKERLRITDGDTEGGERKSIVVPLQTLDKCSVCGKKDRLMLCKSCALAIYCSKECQKNAWKNHKKRCSQTLQINLKTFHPFIAYLFDYFRGILPPTAKHAPHPATVHKIVKGTIPAPRKVPSSTKASQRRTQIEPLKHTIVLGEKHDYAKLALRGWWSAAKNDAEALKLYNHMRKERYSFELTSAVCLILLGEVYASYTPAKSATASSSTSKIEKRPCYRFEHGHVPISDFGICTGRIQSKSNRVQTYTYHHPSTSIHHAFHDPKHHFWIYFRTIKGEEITLDCCAYGFGMENTIDASPCLMRLGEEYRSMGSSRVPAYFCPPPPASGRDDSHISRQAYELVEEHRFSVMQNSKLHEALTNTGPISIEGSRQLIKNFLSSVAGREVSDVEDERVRWYRLWGEPMINQVLSEQHWLEWDRPAAHKGYNSLRTDGDLREYLKGSRFDPALFPGSFEQLKEMSGGQV
ncbi:hypothetical protein P691DRAFT_779224 [Macrolepiota fuliginosa MF-IS2]|uniref:MYND-type domain-containing protein n=1 Tax=Macrolepiota fuliginosa MF-IS2 TaxID=1400762 RepID=A0A9P5X194_9AGAR|nr:hypothetical protein P691DRAFT_779224 [Macrolepiota fuliginosa MF-IS2]